jgi:hypothetical protein
MDLVQFLKIRFEKYGDNVFPRGKKIPNGIGKKAFGNLTGLFFFFQRGSAVITAQSIYTLRDVLNNTRSKTLIVYFRQRIIKTDVMLLRHKIDQKGAVFAKAAGGSIAII